MKDKFLISGSIEIASISQGFVMPVFHISDNNEFYVQFANSEDLIGSFEKLPDYYYPDIQWNKDINISRSINDKCIYAFKHQSYTRYGTADEMISIFTKEILKENIKGGLYKSILEFIATHKPDELENFYIHEGHVFATAKSNALIVRTVFKRYSSIEFNNEDSEINTLTAPYLQPIGVFGNVQLNKRLSNGQNSIATLENFIPGEIISEFSASTISSEPSYLTVQIGDRKHITLVPEHLQYINHSCEPNVFFDTTIMKLIALKKIKKGDELTFFYPATEWKMTQPFQCYCGSPYCLQNIRGAAFLSNELLEQYRFTDFIKQKLTNRTITYKKGVA